MKTSQLVENIINELGIGTRSLARLIDASPTTIHRWINEEVIISDEKLKNLKEINLAIRTLAKNAECSPDSIINALIELKESPLWQGWDNAIQMLSGIDITLQNESYIKKHLLQNPHLIGEGLRLIKRIPSEFYIDALLKDPKGKDVALKFYSKPVAADEYGKIKSLLLELSKKFGSKFTLVLAAPKFAPMFQEISADKKNLTLLEYDFTTTVKIPAGIM